MAHEVFWAVRHGAWCFKLSWLLPCLPVGGAGCLRENL